MKRKFDRVVWEPPGRGTPGEARGPGGRGGSASRRATRSRSGTGGRPTRITGCPGPAGHKSRYEDPAIEKLASSPAAKNKHATYVFTNVDMFADAKRLKKAAKA